MAPWVGGISPSSTRARVDLPQPDSPTMPSTEPRGTSRSTPFTACKVVRGRNMPVRIENCRLTSRACKSGAASADAGAAASSTAVGKAP